MNTTLISRVLISSLRLHNKLALSSAISLNARTLYSKTTLGIDAFNEQRQRTRKQMENIADKFKVKMAEYCSNDSKSMIFTEDLKNMINLSDSEEDIQVVVNMVKKYNQQNKSLRFGNFVFGPVLMRLFYVHNQPDLALECFKSPELSAFFDQLMSYQVLLDLLYENQKYKDMLEVVDIIKNKQLEGTRYPRNIVVLAMAACYKMNTKESLDYALNLWKELSAAGHYPMRRAVTFCAGLALNQGAPEVALEVLSCERNQSYVTVRNEKVAALADIGRLDEAIVILKGVLSEDYATDKVHTFCQDVIDRMKNAVEKSDNPEVTVEFNRIEQLFKKQGHISSATLDEQLCSEIQPPPQMSNRQNRMQPRYDTRNDRNQPRTFNRRPSLSEMV